MVEPVSTTVATTDVKTITDMNVANPMFGCLPIQRSNAYQPSADNAVNCGPLTPMRLGALSFASPLGMCLWQQRPFGSVTLAFVMLTTFVVHRPRKAWSQGLREDFDYVAVLLWYVYNAFLTFVTIAHFSQVGWEVGNTACLVLALCGASGCVILNVVRNKWQYRSPSRDFYHVMMHLSGAVGTVFLLVAARDEHILRI